MGIPYLAVHLTGFMMSFLFVVLLMFGILSSSSYGIPFQRVNHFNLQNAKPRSTDPNAKVRTKRFISGNALNIANLFVLELFPTGIRPNNFVLMKLNIAVADKR